MEAGQSVMAVPDTRLTRASSDLAQSGPHTVRQRLLERFLVMHSNSIWVLDTPSAWAFFLTNTLKSKNILYKIC